jgi:UDP-N-acetylglucosamine 2-epimerase (non-hydrolysing)
LAIVAGARPNFMKVAPLLRALAKKPRLSTILIHTGQHYDANLSDVFFSELGIKAPDVHLGVGGGTHGEQTARILERMENVLQDPTRCGGRLDGLIVVGDVNSTMAASLVAAKLGIPIAHVEAGLRSFDRSMPEEINRIVTDALASVLLVSEPAGIENLRREGHAESELYLVGNLMIDTLREHVDRARKLSILQNLGLRAGAYLVVTMHRPANVDVAATLHSFLEVLVDVARRIPIVFPVHPRTRCRLKEFELLTALTNAAGIHLLEPLGYLDFLCLTSQAQAVITDSGGLQEETTALGIPCLTLRSNTERPITVDEGTSTLLGNDAALLRATLQQVFDDVYKKGKCPLLWDGMAAQRAADVLVEHFG